MILMQHVANSVQKSGKRRRGEGMKVACLTDRGKVRQHNEDSCGFYQNKDGQTLAVVADGMGGHRAGDVASTMTTSILKEYWEQSESLHTPDSAENWLVDHIQKVNNRLFEHAKNNSECHGMGTTVVAAICTPTFSSVAHIGDARCYLLNGSGYKQLTDDHSLVNELVKSGQITKEDAEHHPRKNVILRALGTELTVDVDVTTVILEEEDYLLLCSDGLSNKVSESEMIDILHNGQEIESKVEKLVHLANDYGGEDNISVVIVDYSSNSESR